MVAGRELFAKRGYEHVAAEQIVAAAGVSRGALYHHYRDKRGLFRAVVEDLETEVTAKLAATLDADPDIRSAMAAAVRGYLDICQRPDVGQILLIDAPGILGWQTWRDIETEHGLGLITGLLDSIAHHQPSQIAVPVLAQLILSAVMEGALVVAHANDPTAMREQVEAALLTLVSGLLPSR